MSEFTLVIGNYNLSSWSLRPWLVLKQTGVPFGTVKVDLKTHADKPPEVKVEILKHSPSGRVPVLKHRGLTIWDSLAICEYLAETFPEKNLWPASPAARASARSVSAEMHSGFMGMRTHLSMNMRSSLPMKEIPSAAQADVARIQEIWRSCREQHGAQGPYLFGQFSIADAFYAPVVSRFTTYAPKVDDVSKAYMETIWKLPAMQEWLEEAKKEG